jgi:dTDP-4-dehydrorhamnose 3,5-epimerase
MHFTEGQLPGTYLLVPNRIEDERGFFARAYCRQELEAHGLSPRIVQANTGFSHRRGTLRGLHYQVAPHQETKIVRCVRGAVFDVVVDVRADSPTRGAWMGTRLTAENGHALYVPEGVAHGYLTLEDDSEVLYFVSQYYAPDAERGLRYDDPAVGIDWPIRVVEVSDKDRTWPDFAPAPHPHQAAEER